MAGYPVVRTEFLQEAPSRGVFGLGKKRRDADELPKAGAHEVWVYRIDGRYVVNRGELARDDDIVVRADCVSLVNVSRGAPVTVEMTIPSAEATDFTMRIMFACTVTDAALVVKGNVQASEAILAYLQRDSKLSHLALHLRVGDLNQLRREATARIRAYTEVKPPDVLGLDLRFLGVEVLTPPDLEKFEKERRAAAAEHELKRQRSGYDQVDELDAERHSQGLAGQRQKGRHAAERSDQDHVHSSATKEQRHTQILEAERLKFARAEAEFAADAIDGDPLKAMLIAQACGEISAESVADRMAAAERDRVEYTRRQNELDREDDRSRYTWDREQEAKERSAAWDSNQESLRHRRQMELEDTRADRDDAREERRETRQDARDERRAEREDRHKRLDLQLEVLREFAKRGHLDMINVQVDKMVADIYSGAALAVSQPDREALADADKPAELPSNKAAPSEDMKNDSDDDNPVQIPLDSKDEDDDSGR